VQNAQFWTFRETEKSMRWPDVALSTIDAAIAAAKAGEPTVLTIEGDAGMGKSSLLRDLVARLDGFHLLRAGGEESAQDEPLRVLQEWDALPPLGGTGVHSLQAARYLGDVIDRLQLTGPVALIVDDLQWVDPESVEAFATLMRRAAGDRLLVVAAHRPLARRHAGWARLSDDIGRAVRLDGIDETTARELVEQFAPGLSPALAAQLREHTGSSPLYLRALLREHAPADLASLAARDELPAPTTLARHMDERLIAMDGDAAQLMRALAVIGDRWSDLPTAAAVGGVREPEAAVALLRDERLVRLDRSGAVTRIRIYHSVIRAAVYDAIPPGPRRQLHSAAAARLSTAGERLRHRAAALVDPEESLAHELDDYSDELHQQMQYREASRYRRIASSVSATPEDAERRSLDADLEAIFARDLDDVVLDTSETDPRPQQRLVKAEQVSTLKSWAASAALLDAISDEALEGLSPLNAYRVRVARAWSRTGAGRDPLEILPDIEIAMASPIHDPAMRGRLMFAYGQALQLTTAEGEMWDFAERATQRAALAASPEGIVQLSWRGSVYSLTGIPSEAIGDLSIVTDRIGDGMVDFADGAFHALLGFAQWLAGDWRRASINIGLPLSTPLGARHLVAIAIAPLTAIVANAPVQPLIDRSRLSRLAAPMRIAGYAADISDVAALAYSGTDEERRTWSARRSADFGDPRERIRGAIPYLWYLANGLGSAWAGDADAVRFWAMQLSNAGETTWRDQASAWLHALAFGIDGDERAARLLAIEGLPGLPAFEALLRGEAARAAAVENHPAAARTRETAVASLQAVGASAYAERLLPPAEDSGSVVDPLEPLSDRERDVVTLLLEGLSYAQIAKELYVTRSTVSFHLTNAYAKTNTNSRHELVQLVRAA
jgi:DNA-binding CsgD family transcriptional regulator